MRSDKGSQLPLLRFAAFVLDTLSLALLLIIPATVISYGAVWLGGGTKWISIVWYVALLILLLGTLFRDGWKGRSPGKRLLGLRITTRSGKSCGWFRSFARNLPLLIPPWLLIEILLVALDRNRTGDRIAGTVVREE
ncbi:MAG TPA: RDD family protein [Thermoanaerobaculia bacterium]|nr:RDD family protein [Thermoanaerobaculia bacterium]